MKVKKPYQLKSNSVVLHREKNSWHIEELVHEEYQSSDLVCIRVHDIFLVSGYVYGYYIIIV